MKILFFASSLLITLIIINLDATAQKDSSNKPTVVVTYTKVGSTRPEHDRNISTLIKVNPLLVFNGDMPIYLERRISDKLSIEGALGVTYMNYIYEATAINELYTPIEDREAKLGFSALGSIKFYPSSYTKALDEFYFGSEVRFRKYQTEALDCSTNSLRAYVPESREMLDIKIMFGYVSYLSDRVIADFYGGFGLRKRDYSRAYCDTVNGFDETINIYTDDIVPTISAGIKIGFGI